MANVSLKKDFRDGDKLFAQQLNNNFSAIEEGLKGDNKIIWQEKGTEVKFYKGNTPQVAERPIEDGQLLYNTDTGETALDDNGERIVTGSGNVVAVGGEQPENLATKLWIEQDSLATLGTEVVDSLEGNQTNKAPSVASVVKALGEIVEIGNDAPERNVKRYYIKFSNGLMICGGREYASDDATTQYGNAFKSDPIKMTDFIVPFTNVFSSNVDFEQATWATGNIIGIQRFGYATPTNIGDVIIFASAASVNNGGYINYKAIGTWK